MAAQLKDQKSRPRYRDFVYGLAAPVSYLDIFAYLRFGDRLRLALPSATVPPAPSSAKTQPPTYPCRVHSRLKM